MMYKSGHEEHPPPQKNGCKLTFYLNPMKVSDFISKSLFSMDVLSKIGKLSQTNL